MLTTPARPSTRIVGLVAVLALFWGIGVTIRSLADRDSVAGSATLDIDGLIYEFEPSTCTITETDFLAAGAGKLDGEDFWISATPDVVGLTHGTSEPPSRSSDQGSWLRSVGGVTWHRIGEAGDTVEAEVVLQDERRLESAPVDGHLSVTCDAG